MCTHWTPYAFGIVGEFIVFTLLIGQSETDRHIPGTKDASQNMPRGNVVVTRFHMKQLLITANLWPAEDPRDPSESIVAAYEVVEAIRKRDARTQAKFIASIEAQCYEQTRFDDAMMWMIMPPPEAICKAALTAVQHG